MPHPLTNSYAKLARAQEHIEAVQRDVNAFLGGYPSPTSLPIKDESEELRDFARRFAGREVPISIRIVAGEAIHQLRSVLDHVAYQLVSLSNPPGDKSGFPIYTEAPKNAREWKLFDRAIDGANQNVRDFVIEWQPWQWQDLAASHLFAVLRDVDDDNKHRLPMLAVARAVPVRVMEWLGGWSMRLQPWHAEPRRERGTVVKHRLQPSIVFPHFGRRENVPVVDGLVELYEFVGSDFWPPSTSASSDRNDGLLLRGTSAAEGDGPQDVLVALLPLDEHLPSHQCRHLCRWRAPYGFVAEAGCPEHD
jgi:hypothetical protein